MQEPELEYVEHLKEAPLKLMVVSLDASAPHWHDEYEVNFVLRGAITVNCEGNKFELSAGDMMLINSREVHSMTKIGPDVLCLFLQFSPSVIAEIYNAPFRFSLNTVIGTPSDSAIIGQFQALLAHMGLLLHEKSDGYQFAIKSDLYAFVSSMFRFLQYQRITSDLLETASQLEDLAAIQKYIKEHFKENINPLQISKTLGMSKTKVYRLLSTAGCASTHDMINYYRVEYAKHLLKTTDYTISYIAAESGFESDSSFYRVFRSQAGIPPMEFRKTPVEYVGKVGVQGYVPFSVPESIGLLQAYSRST